MPRNHRTTQRFRTLKGGYRTRHRTRTPFTSDGKWADALTESLQRRRPTKAERTGS